MRILIIKTSSMGDVIHTLPAVTELAKHYPDAQIDWVVEESFQDIPKLHPAVHKVIPVSIRRWRKNLFNKKTKTEITEFINNLREYSHDYVVDAQGLLKSALIAVIAKTQHKKALYGFDKDSSRGKYSSLLYNKSYHIDKNKHAIYRLKDLFAKIFNYKIDSKINYGLDINCLMNTRGTVIPAEEAGSSKSDLNNRNKYLVFFHCTTWNSKKWPAPYWRELIQLAFDNGYKVKLNSGNAKELEESKILAQGFNNNQVEVLPILSIAELIDLISNSTAVVSVDTGLGHLAAALDKPGVGIYGATNPKLTAVLSDKFINLSSSYECSPCLQRECDKLNNSKLGYPPCYKELSSNRIWDSIINVSKI